MLAVLQKGLAAKFGKTTSAALCVYQQQCDNYVTDTQLGRKPPGPFQQFAKERMTGQLAGIADKNERRKLFADLMRDVGQEWKNMSEERKQEIQKSREKDEKKRLKELKNASADEINELLAERCNESINKAKKQIKMLEKKYNKPLSPRYSSYSVFLREHKLFGPKAAEQWKKLDEKSKQKYEEQSSLERKERREQVKDWEEKMGKEGLQQQFAEPDVDAIFNKESRKLAKEMGRPASSAGPPIGLFAHEFGLKPGAEAGQKWNELSEKDKEKYKQEAAQLRKEHLAAVAKWEKSLKPEVLELLTVKPKSKPVPQ